MEEKKYCNRFLPLGTIVKLKSGPKKVMITGFCMYDNNNNHKIYDYCGCMYPEGMLSNREASLFNHDDILEIVHMGLNSEEEKAFKINLSSMMQIIEKTSVEPNVIFNKEENEY